MQRHPSSLCTPMQGLLDLSRPCHGYGISMLRSEPAHGIHPGALVPVLERFARRSRHLMATTLLTVLKSLGVALYVAMAIIVMALVLRAAGIAPADVAGLHLPRGGQEQSQQVDARAQVILDQLAGGQKGVFLTEE